MQQGVKSNVLYVCYQSVTEPLTRTQVIAYLEGLAAHRHHILLLTFEPEPPVPDRASQIRKELLAIGIEWRWLRYHKRPTVPATAFDILMGTLYGLRLIRKHRVHFVHARSHVPGVMALALRRLAGTRFLFDVRGLLAEEYVDAGIWPANGKLFSLAKKFERKLIAAADSVIVLTERGGALLRKWYPAELGAKSLTVVPCCVDLRGLALQQRPEGKRSITIAYVGKLGGWYATREMIRFITVAREIVSCLRFQIWTQSDHSAITAQICDAGISGTATVGSLSPHEVVPYLSRNCDAALSFIRPCLSKQASSPTKIAEYLAAGIPVITSIGIGDLDQIVTSERVGIAVGEFTDDAYRQAARQLLSLLEDGTLRARCKAVAKKYFDLEQVGWVRYRAVYEQFASA